MLCIFLIFVGTRTKCLGKLVGVVSSWRYLCWCDTWLVVVNRERVVKP